MRLDQAPWPSIPTGGLLILPLGSTEQHGPHLPFSVDTDIASAVAAAVAERVESVLAPTLPYGSSGEHQQFPGTLSMGREALASTLIELVRSAESWASRVLLVNGHGGNASVLIDVVTQLRDEQHDVAWVACAPQLSPGTVRDAHAGRTETSLMLHLTPCLVGEFVDVSGASGSLREVMPLLAEGRLRELSPSGVLGDPRGASKNEGAALMSGLVADVVALVETWRVVADGRLA